MTEIQNEDVTPDLTKTLDFMFRRRWIVLSVWAISLLAAILITNTTRPVYKAVTLIEIEKEKGRTGLYDNATMVDSANAEYFQTQYRLFQSNSVLEKAYSSLGLDKDPEFGQPGGVSKLRRAISIAPILGTRLANIQALSFDPKKAAMIANAIGESFLAQNLSNQLFISQDILQSLLTKKNVVNDSLPAVVNNGLIQNMKAEYVKFETKYAEMSEQYTPKYPAMISLRSEMDALKRQIDSETRKVVESVKTELSGQLQGNNARIIDPAEVPSAPIKPQPMKNYLFACLGGFVLGIIIAYLAELMDQSIRTQEDIEVKLRLPFVGAIPFYPQSAQETVYHSLRAKESSLSSEAFRNLRTMVDLAGVSTKTNILLVTSSVQEEGKSYVASNLAVAFAQLGEHVILVDGDLRRPKIHKNFRLSANRGLSEFLAKGSKTEELFELVQATEEPNLKVLPAGPRPPNPSELLNTPRLSAFIAWARSNFNRVIIDCTPMFPINDTLLWGRHVGAAVFVTRYGKTRVPLIKHACQKLQAGGVSILGVAVNATKMGGLSYSPYDYYYHQYYRAYAEEAPASKA